jgi:serine protease Do
MAPLSQGFGIERSNGFIVIWIETGSPADKSEIEVGDVIVAANDKPTRSSRDMHNLAGLRRLGQTIELVLFRDGAEVTLPVKIQPIEINKLSGALIHSRLDGATIDEMREQHLQRGRVDYLEVMKVEQGSSAQESGSRVGDIIYSINQQLTRSFDEVFALMEANDKGMIMNIQRGNRELYILLK